MAGRTKNALTEIRKNSKESRDRLMAMVKSYCVLPGERKAKAILLQLENVEQNERILREEVAKSEGDLFADFEEEIEAEELEFASDDSPVTEPDEEDEEETPTPKAPAILRPVTAKSQNKK